MYSYSKMKLINFVTDINNLYKYGLHIAKCQAQFKLVAGLAISLRLLQLYVYRCTVACVISDDDATVPSKRHTENCLKES